MDGNSYMVTQRGAGVNLSVDIAATTADASGSGIAALVRGDAITAQGLYPVPPHSAVINEAITTANATNPRVDRVILEIQDNTHDASGANLIRTRVVAGTATSGATLANLSGAAAVPPSALLLADVLVPANDTTIDNTQIRDRRSWARGIGYFTANTVALSTTSSTFAALGSALYAPRLECSGAPVLIVLECEMSAGATGKAFEFDLLYDGSLTGDAKCDISTATTTRQHMHAEWLKLPAAGSHTFAPAFRSVDNSTSLSLLTGAVTMYVIEIPRQNAANNSVTSG